MLAPANGAPAEVRTPVWPAFPGARPRGMERAGPARETGLEAAGRGRRAGLTEGRALPQSHQDEPALWHLDFKLQPPDCAAFSPGVWSPRDMNTGAPAGLRWYVLHTQLDRGSHLGLRALQGAACATVRRKCAKGFPSLCTRPHCSALEKPCTLVLKPLREKCPCGHGGFARQERRPAVRAQ